jgi:hypothetical protein
VRAQGNTKQSRPLSRQTLKNPPRRSALSNLCILWRPMVVWRADMDKTEAAKNTMVRSFCLENANALPTYPRQKQKQKQQEAA